MSNKRIRSLLEGRLKTWAAARSTPIRVAYQNVQFTPNSGETYLRCFVLPATTGSDTLEGEHRRYEGVWQVNIVKPLDGGLGSALGIEDELATLFPINLQLTSSGFELYIRTPMGSGSPIFDDLNVTLPVSCRYRADTP